MLFEENIIEIQLSPQEIKLCRINAKKSAIGGKSNVRGKGHRENELHNDQLVGQLGECALSKYLTGSTDAYMLQRSIANSYPTSGDGGQDIFGLNVDIKTSVMRYNAMGIPDYHLVVRPQEKHDHWCYILGLVEKDFPKASPFRGVCVYLVGWIASEELPSPPEQYGPFKGAHTIKAMYLHPLPNLRWLWNLEQ